MIPKIHPLFKLNGRPLDHEGLMIVAYSYIKEGEPWEREIGDFLLNWLDDFDFVTVLSSGSTGTPKPIRLYKQHMVNSATLTEERFNIHEESIVLSCLPYSYISGKMMMVRALHSGWDLDLVEPCASPLKNATKRYDFTAITTYQLKNSLDYLHKSRKIIVGGGPISTQLINELDGKHSKIYHTYAMTETASHIAVRKLHPEYFDTFELLPNINVALDDRGCLVISASEILPDTLITNDLAQIDDNGRFKILGRVDNVINTGGVKVNPEEIEQLLSSLLKKEFFITSADDELLGQRVVLVIEGEDIDYDQIIKDAQLSKYQNPREIVCIDEFKHTHTGKIDKRATLNSVINQG
ncbi:MAG: AMP-binding protein [Nonlabens sp.]